MRTRYLGLFLLLACAGTALSTAQTSPPASSLVERVENTGFIQIEAPSFAALDARQQQLAYWLTQASIAIDPIIYDQLSQYGLREKRLLEGIMRHSDGVAPAALAKIRRFALLFWANRGNHNETTGAKFLPAFTAGELESAALAAQKNGAFASPYGDLPALATPADVRRELSAVGPSLFDAAVEPLMTAKTPPPGKDIVQASSNTFYRGVTLDDLKGFAERYPLNSRVVKGADGVIREEVYRAGTPNGSVPPGVYAVFLNKAIGYL
jgi:dipeptidyl-peptidase-3